MKPLAERILDRFLEIQSQWTMQGNPPPPEDQRAYIIAEIQKLLDEGKP